MRGCRPTRVHGAPSKHSIAGYRSLLPGKSDPQILYIYGRGSYYCAQEWPACEEDDEYLTLLNDYGQPTKSNAEAKGKFASTFPQRSMPSIKAHINAFEQVQSDDGKPARWEKVCR